MEITQVKLTELPGPRNELVRALKECPSDEAVRISKKGYDEHPRWLGGLLGNMSRHFGLKFELIDSPEAFFLKPVNGETKTSNGNGNGDSRHKAGWMKIGLGFDRSGVIKNLPRLYTKILLAEVKKQGEVRVYKRAFAGPGSRGSSVSALRDSGCKVTGTNHGSRIITIKKGVGSASNN